MSRHVLALDLKDDPALIERYREWHAPGKVPEPVMRSIRDSDILEMEIWVTGNRLIMIMTTGERFDPARKAANDSSNPDVVAWEKLMDTFQQALPWAQEGRKWTPAEQIFTLS